MTNLRNLSYFLGISVTRHPQGCFSLSVSMLLTCSSAPACLTATRVLHLLTLAASSLPMRALYYLILQSIGVLLVHYSISP
jgi:hypothetical protein